MPRNFTPEEAVERYLRERRSDLSDSSIYNYQTNLGKFVEWCKYQSHIDHIEDIDQFDVADFRLHREDELADTTLYNTMMTLRTFIKWCEGKGLLYGISEGILLPDRGRVARTETISPDTAEKILDYLEKYEYVSMRHTAFALLWDCGVRIGAVRSLDLDDFHSTEAYVELHHRPVTDKVGEGLNDHRGTPLKNGEQSEREVNLHEWVAEIVDDYIEGRRHDVTDDFDREPLLTTKHGRPARTTIRRHITAVTRPCFYTGECTVDREIEECEANSFDTASQCPESIRPHSVRRSAITAWLDDGHSKELISDRMDVSTDVLEEHYDQRTEEQKRKLRRDMFDM